MHTALLINVLKITPTYYFTQKIVFYNKMIFMKYMLTTALLVFKLVCLAQVGIGTTAPKSSLHIVSKTEGALSIEDGTQGAGKVLTSNNVGQATWVAPRKTVFGAYPTATDNLSSKNDGVTYARVNLNLEPGKWVIHCGYQLSISTSLLGGAKRRYVHATLSNSTTQTVNNDFRYLGTNNTNRSFAGSIFNPGTAIFGSTAYDLITGTIAIEVTSATATTIYLLLENVGNNDWTYNTNAPENYFYAVPIN
ncbi:hypothetical protein K5I29_05605 [Flavobacterium agricola]|uniref:Uncharacterized protein n=1 Tax=Flavobacterium agricola TaxID=2870839 RepID=A0ABY6M3F0_9FLAO|nr:hypothetical protein [Flavobacterium agricola]UYW02370.1 hypothetical protein K5I29_05605 [Flavobacterium agricola]